MSTMMLDRPTSGHRVDWERGVIKSLKLVGTASKRNRRYPIHVLRQAARLYENAPCYVNHNTPGERRKAEDLIGRFANIREAADGSGLIGDLHFNAKHPMADRLAWAAENNPALFGCSHNAAGPTRRESDGSETVLRIDRVHSVDIVGEPATTCSLFESDGCLCDLLESLGGDYDRRDWTGRRIITEAERVAWLKRMKRFTT